MGNEKTEPDLDAYKATWDAYMKQYKRSNIWYWVSNGGLAIAIGFGVNAVAQWSLVLMIFNAAVFMPLYLSLVIVYLNSALKLGKKRRAWQDEMTKLETARKVGWARREAIRDFQDAMIKQMRAERQAREEAAQQPVRAERLEIEGNCIDNG